MKNEFGKWSLEYPANAKQTDPDTVYFRRGEGCCKVIPGNDVDLQSYRRLIASAPEMCELLELALPALEHIGGHLVSESVVDRVKAVLAFIEGGEACNNQVI